MHIARARLRQHNAVHCQPIVNIPAIDFALIYVNLETGISVLAPVARAGLRCYREKRRSSEIL
jgi:hypothetical protein